MCGLFCWFLLVFVSVVCSEVVVLVSEVVLFVYCLCFGG